MKASVKSREIFFALLQWLNFWLKDDLLWLEPLFLGLWYVDRDRYEANLAKHIAGSMPRGVAYL